MSRYKFVQMPRRKYRKEFPKVSKASVWSEEGGEPAIYYPEKMSTRTRLHEMFHLREGAPLIEGGHFRNYYRSPDEYALEELTAEEYTNKTMGKPCLTLNIVWGVAGGMLGQGCSPATILGSITRALKTLGYKPLDREDRSSIWQGLRELSNEKS